MNRGRGRGQNFRGSKQRKRSPLGRGRIRSRSRSRENRRQFGEGPSRSLSRGRNRDKHVRNRERRRGSPNRRDRNAKDSRKAWTSSRREDRFEELSECKEFGRSSLHRSRSKESLRMSPPSSLGQDINDVVISDGIFNEHRFSLASEESFSNGNSFINRSENFVEQRFSPPQTIELRQPAPSRIFIESPPDNHSLNSNLMQQESCSYINEQLRFEQKLPEENNSFGTASVSIFNKNEVDIPNFDPQTSTYTSRQWINMIDKAGNNFNWTKDEKKYFMSTKLVGAAKQWYVSTNKTAEDWHKVRSDFFVAFPSDMEFERLLRKMLAREKSMDESYANYFDHKISLLDSCGITGPKAVSCVIGGFKDGKLKQQAFAQYFSNIDALYQFVRKYENTRETQPQQNNNNKAFNKKNRRMQAIGNAARNWFKKNKINETERSIIMFGALSKIITLDKYYVTVKVNGVAFPGYIDFKSQVTTVQEQTLTVARTEFRKCFETVSGFNSCIISSIGQGEANIEVDEASAVICVYVIPNHIQAIPVVIGQSFLQHPSVVILQDDETIHLYQQPNQGMPSFMNRQPGCSVDENQTIDSIMETDNIQAHDKQDDMKIKTKMQQDQQMTSSILSVTSSLASPGDSGVQLLDSESEMTSVMSASGIGYDIDMVPNLENDDSSSKIIEDTSDPRIGEAADGKSSFSSFECATMECDFENCKKSEKREMTKSDIVNQNIEHYDLNSFSSSVPSYVMLNRNSNCFEKVLAEAEEKHALHKSLSDEVFEPDKPKETEIKQVDESDLMNVSLNSYELLDYTSQNGKSQLQVIADDPMHVSMSEEVNEGLQVLKTEIKPEITADDQIVYRRQRKKKSKSDTPKKRVSFHEDILNSTKIDDIHINHGFVTHEPDVSFSFFQNGFIRKPDVVQGRYSWAAEGDAPYYKRNVPERQIKSDIYIHHPRYSSSSSSSSVSASSSVDEEDHSEENFTLSKPINTAKMPKSSCLKKTKRNKKHIDTKIVEEANLKKKESSLLDANILGSLKNILNFSTSVPLAERGVPEGQEDISVYTSAHETSRSRHSSLSESTFDVTPAPVRKIGNLNLELAKTNLKLTNIEGFYPNYPEQNLPSNIVLCDSNVYEHKGISYSYEYDKFQKTFEQHNKPKSSTVYQMILKEFNFFKRKSKESEKEANEDMVTINSFPDSVKPEMPAEVEPKTPKQNINKYASTFKLDWSDNETVSDHTENINSRHLNSPKRKINKSNHYSVQPFKAESLPDLDSSSKALQGLRPASSKSSLINRFLRNVTLKKMLDMRAQKKNEFARKYFSLYIREGKVNMDQEKSITKKIEEEIIKGKQNKRDLQKRLDGNLLFKFRNEVFRNANEILHNMFPVNSSYTTSGICKPLLIILSDSTLYIVGLKPNNVYFNHFVLPYTDLNTVLIGPNSQTIHFSNYANDMQCLVTTGCAIVTGDIVGQLEIAMRKDSNRPRLPAVKQLSMRDMVYLRKAICKQTSVDKEEEYFYYGVVNIQDSNSDGMDTPLGPNKEGPLMFKISDSETRWETAYFILKAGVLYMLSSPSYRVPMKVFPLINGACQGARRVYHYRRPHTFQIVVEGSVLYLAAPDEYVASEWLQALVHAASGTYTHEKILARSCSLMITSDHILTVREALPCAMSSLIGSEDRHQPIAGPQILSCASIPDITAFRLPSAEHSWCVLEFACREAHECSGDWILYFSSNAELEKFISALELLWGYHNEEDECFPLSTIPDTDPLNKKCMEVYNNLQKTCLPLMVHYF